MNDNEIENIIERIKNEEVVLLFDMDGTLIDTDLANFSSYKNAIESVIKLDQKLEFNPNERFNRTTLKTVVSNLTENQYQKIIELKEENYKDFLPKTKLNNKVANILTKFQNTNRTVLVTNCRKDRAITTLNYHNLFDKFNDLLFRKSSDSESRTNKYKNAISSLSLSAQTVIAFENEKQEIDDAIDAGIPFKNIISL
ncbi:Beta-phosphoglucomutase, HAD superfamily [Cyclobacterium lianum]|uniref:Beta-phosphoglucomutase, HAD superfamily n=1 Tax=Cyclobacterium lianum TaxID=388280 RepID=A0A1M7PV93_9BACT|nr:HAD hydrolase-like protein [Cyclobacterium lianum]SHN21489.1 Beta-phosphoglucomutase, HAD superfamily [Cyclobacterium lianum]